MSLRVSPDFRSPRIVFVQIYMTGLNHGRYYQLITNGVSFGKHMLYIQARAAGQSANYKDISSADEQFVLLYLDCCF